MIAKTPSSSRTFAALVMILLAACAGQEATESPETEAVVLANPASAYCEGLGYELELVDGEEGQQGICSLPDGSTCEEWDLLAGRCEATYSFCELNGGTLEEGEGNVGNCVFPDGSTCAEIDFFEGSCGPEEEAATETPEAGPGAARPALEGSLLVQGWMGYVVSAPAGSEYDDYLVLVPEGTGEFGVTGIDETLEERIIALRDVEEPGKYANFWGTLTCEAPDYNGCQLVVTAVRAGAEMVIPELVQGWTGQIHSSEADSQFPRYFELDGPYPVRFGIASAIAANGWPVFEEEIVALMDTGQSIEVSGQLLCGVPDVNACQLQVNGILVDGEPVDPYDGWATYTNEEYGFSFRYPTTWTLEEVLAEDGTQTGPSVQLKMGDLLVYIGYRRVSEDLQLGGSGAPAGEFEERGIVWFLGQDVEKSAVVLDEKDKAIFYSMAVVGDLVFVIRVDDFGPDYDAVNIPFELQFEIDQILGSFTLLE